MERTQASPAQTQEDVAAQPDAERQSDDGKQANRHGADRFLHKLAGGIERGAEKVKDGAMNLGGEAVGEAERLGLRYPVKHYSEQVSPELWRGSRVDAQGMADLKAKGVKGIVNLCLENNDDAAPAEKLGLAALHIPILDNSPPTVAQVQQFLDFVKSNGPVYVHCEAGVGRTGTMVACYRMAAEGWTAQKAIDEAKGHGLAMPNQLHFLQWYYDNVVSKEAAAPVAAAAASPNGAT